MPLLTPLHRNLIALSAPIAGIQLAQVALTTTDLAMMGLIGLDALAAGGLAALLYNQFRTMCAGMVTGLGNFVAAAIAQSERRMGDAVVDGEARVEIRDLIRAALLIATASAFIAGALLAGLGYCLPLLGQDRAVAIAARPVMIALAFGLLPMVWLNVLRQFAVGMRRPGSLLWVTLASIAVNALLNAVFIYGWLGIPRLGLTGIGLATTLVQVWTFLVYLRMLRRDEVLRDFITLSFWKARPATVLRIAKMGAPISLTYGLEASMSSVASVLIGTFGPIVLAASNIIIQLAKITYQVNVGLSHGASIMVSRAMGRQQPQDIAPIARAALVLCFVPMAIIGLMCLLWPRLVLWPFLRSDADPAILSAASFLLPFAVATQFFAGAQNICIGLLRGLGDTSSGLTLTSIGYGLIGMPALWVCSRWMGEGGAGAWLGLCIAFGATSVLLWHRFACKVRCQVSESCC